MAQKKQTAVTDFNRKQFYQTLFPVVSMTKNQMIDIQNLANPVLIDCAGKFYKTVFSKNVLIVETLQTAKEFELDRSDFDILFKSDDNIVVWPKKIPSNSDLILDYSRLVRYKTLEQLQKLLENLLDQLCPNSLHLRMHLHHLDDSRICDRFYNICTLKFTAYVVTVFVYNINQGIFELAIKRKYEDSN